MYASQIAWCCLFSYFISGLEGVGFEPVLNLAATPDEAVSMICTVVVDKTIPLTFGRS